MRAPRGYEDLARVLQDAIDQSASGKGKERHASEGEAFDQQQIVKFQRWQRSTAFATGQCAKKALESERLPRAAARRELLGAIVYAAAAVIALDARPEDVEQIVRHGTEWHPPARLPRSRAQRSKRLTPTP